MPSRKLFRAAALTLMSSGLIVALAMHRAGRGKTWHRTLTDGPSVEPEGEVADEGRDEGGQAASSREAAEVLRAAEIPEAGFPVDRNDDADRIRPGLSDFARGA